MSVVDLFAGPGGWSVAAAELGLTEIGIEHDASACATRAAAGHLTIRQDVTTLDTARFRPLDGLIASPPCPTFSAAGGRAGIAELRYLIEHVHACVTEWRPYVPPENLGFDGPQRPIFPDPRSALVLEPLRFALECVPTWIALEQVPDVLPVWEAMSYVLRAHAYSVWCGILNSADYGVPQTRRRAILIAHRKREVSPPEPTHCEGGASTLLGELAPWVSMAEALGWGRLAPSPTQVGDMRLGGATSFSRQQMVKERAEGRWVEQVDPADIRVGFPRLDDRGGQWAFERPATAVCGDARLSPPGFRGRPDDYDADGNYTGSRSMDDALKLSVSDALKLQSFDASYPVQGTKTKRFEQIGNAIPVLLARRILSEVL